ncbi:MAG: squalene/phytoene synthase family protein [candidate division NC10 bacterium]|nr:squalene/phytoene synthase family protein [candidate division NC10 bacterium]
MTHIGSAPSTARDISRALTRASRSNFYYAFLFLPRHKREALYAVYAFCRVTDDLVDEAAATPSGHARPAAGTPPPAGLLSPAGTPVERLKAWREELEACFRGEATHPVTQRLAETIRTFRIPHGYFEELLNGVEMDLAKFRYATFAELQQYCYRVAGVVGLMCIEVFGYTHPMTRTYAQHLGTAFQLTNILRDLATDGERGRIYLPQEDLKRLGVTEADLLERRVTPAFLELMRFEVGRARQFYAAARAALPAEDRRTMLAAEIMGAIYARILDRIEVTGYDVFSRRIRLSDTHRLWLALHCWARHRLRTA